MQAHGFRFYFTPLPGVLPTFPSRYWYAIGLRQSLALRDGPRGFGQDSTCPALLRCRIGLPRLARTGVSPSAPSLSRKFRFVRQSISPVLQPRTVREHSGLGSSLFDRHTGGIDSFFLLLRVLRCFSSPGSPQTQSGARPSAVRVAPFGHVRIKPRLRVPGPFRSLPRPSSPAEAKASSVRSDFSSSVNLSLL